MTVFPVTDRESLRAALKRLAPGDCIEIDRFSAVSDSSAAMLAALAQIRERGAALVSREEGLDTRSEQGAAFLRLCAALQALDRSARLDRQRAGIERAREAGKYKGRKPIMIDSERFNSVVERWQSGQITAREAMSELDLKPNTFYRRIKEREEQRMKDYKQAEKELREELKEAVLQGRRDLDELKKQVREEAEEVKRSAEEKLDLHDVEWELRRDRHRAENEHTEAVKQLKRDVASETKELKKLLEEE